MTAAVTEDMSGRGLPASAVVCTWCGLPVASTGAAEAVASEAAVPQAQTRQKSVPVPDDIYCCFGCRLAHAIADENSNAGSMRWTTIRLGLSVFFSMNLMAFTMTMWSLDVYDVQRDALQTQMFAVFRWLSLVLSLPVLLLLGVPLLQNAADSWRRRIFSTDLLIVVGVAAAYAVSAVAVIRGHEKVYFEVGAAVLVMVTLGRWLEATGRQKATESLEQLAALLPETARRIACGTVTLIRSASIQEGDELQIRPGDRFPVDAEILDGVATVDEQVFTGESLPVVRRPGERVSAGTVNLDHVITVKAISQFRSGSFARLLSLLQEARLSRGHYQRLADRVSSWFLPLVVGLAVVAVLLHWRSGAGVAIQAGLSVLLIACPCALGMATPLAIWTALSTALKHQVLFRSGEAIERLARVTTVCFDKTGTLTTGQPQVTSRLLNSGLTLDQLLPLCAAVAQTSSHPFSQAICQYVRDRHLRLLSGDANGLPAVEPRWPVLTDVQAMPGAGVCAVDSHHQKIRLGSPEFVSHDPGLSEADRQRLRQTVASADLDADAMVLVTVNSVPAVLFLMSESLRPEASVCFGGCAQLGLPVRILTGDREARARRLQQELCGDRNVTAADADLAAVASQQAGLGIQVLSGLRPEQKVAELQRLRTQGDSVAMAGDGVNDAPALATCDIGIAMGCGADVSRNSAQVCLLSNDLSRIPWAIALSRRTTAIIRQNLFWSFAYNFVGVLLAVAGLLNPAFAAMLMILSSLLVISNSLRLLSETPQSTSDGVAARSTEVLRHSEAVLTDTSGQLLRAVS
ncbi:MAG: Cation-transporting ATPase PacS [Planctomycetota bacterium]